MKLVPPMLLCWPTLSVKCWWYGDRGSYHYPVTFIAMRQMAAVGSLTKMPCVVSDVEVHVEAKVWN